MQRTVEIGLGSFTVALLAALLVAPGLADAQAVAVVTGDGACPAGMTPLTVQQAEAQRATICAQLGQWHIARLAGGGSMDGPGYHCQTRAVDTRGLGHTLCVAAAPMPPPAAVQISVTAGVYDAVGRRWRDTITLGADGSVERGNGERGRWSVDRGSLVIEWHRRGRGGRDRLDGVTQGVFRGRGLTLTLRAAPPPPPPPPPVASIEVRPGVFDGVHPHWRDTVTLAPDGTYRRGNGDPGRWYTEGNFLVLDWQNWGAERLERVGRGVFRAPSNGFTLTRREGGGPVVVTPPPPPPPPPPPLPPPARIVVDPGVYDAVHPHWRDTVTLNADGTYQRGSGDPGVWRVEGNELVLAWRNWGPERLARVSRGVYRAASNGFTLTVRAAPVAPPRVQVRVR